MAAIPQYDKVHDALIEGLDNLAKWYKKTDDSTAYFICLGMIHKNDVSELISLLNPPALDPNVKVAYAQHLHQALGSFFLLFGAQIQSL